MALALTAQRIESDLFDDRAIRTHDDTWLIGGPLLGPIKTVSHTTALALLTVLDAVKTIHPDTPCPQCQTWLQAVSRLLGNLDPITKHVSCLYCGSTDVFETPVVIDERHTDLALECGECHGTWAA